MEFVKPKQVIIFAVAASCLTLIGCATHHPSSTISATKDPSNITLAEAATSVSHSLVNLAATEQAAFHPINTQNIPDPTTYGMGGHVSIDWSGPIEPIVQQITQAASYRLRVVGKEPAVPILVTVNAKNQMLGDILSNVAYQCGKRADIVLYPETQVVELRYAPN